MNVSLTIETQTHTFLYSNSGTFDDSRSGPVHSHDLSVHQPSVLGDLHLQPGLGVQQHLVLLALTLQVQSQLRQLVLQH